jgi:integrase
VTVNATLTAVCEFLRFCARTGAIEQSVAGQLSEPRWLRFTPPGFDAGEYGQFRMVRARMLKARAATAFPEAFTPEQAERVSSCCRRPRERFMVTLLRDSGLRIGEALGLRRSDVHLLPDSRWAGCAVLGAHVHARHRANPNGALAKSRFPRTVPASDAVLSTYADYQHERAEILGEDDCDLVFVNLYREPLGAPMTYRAAKRLFERLARDCGFAVRPHMFRHTAATSWEVSRIATGASFGRSREHALPAAQRAALRCRRPGGPLRGCGDLGFHRPSASVATMMRLGAWRDVHHRWGGCPCDASGCSWLRRVHHAGSGGQCAVRMTARGGGCPGPLFQIRDTRLTWGCITCVAARARMWHLI